MLSALVLALSQQVIAGDQARYEFDLPAQPLAEALNGLSEQADILVLFSSDLVLQRQSRPVIGEYTLQQALDRLLKGTGLTAGLTEQGVLTVQKAALALSTQEEREEMTKSKKGFLAALVSIFSATGAVSSHAEEGVKNKGGIEEIVVTALKREQSLLEVPIAVSAFTGNDLEDIGANSMADFLQSAPGTSLVDSGNGDQNIAIRGISSTFGDSPVGYYLDEVPFNMIGVQIVPDVRTFDIERVEVLRGPQGTLYGASSLGGTVRILTNDPVHNEVQAKVDVTGSSTRNGGDNYGVKAAINVPLIDDTLSLRLVGTKEDEEGWLDIPDTASPFVTVPGKSDVNNRDIETLRAKLRWTPSDNVELILGASSYRSDADSAVYGGDNGEYLGLYGLSVLAPTETEYDLYSAELTINFDGFDLVSSTSYIDTEQNMSGTLLNDRTADSLAQELRLNSNGDGPWHWVAGLYYRDLTTDFAFTFAPFPPSTQETTSESWAVFGELTYEINEEWEATVGLRRFEDERDRNDTFGAVFPTIKEEYSSTTPRFNVAWRPNDMAMIYANIAKGFRSGVTQPAISIATAASLTPPISIPEGVKAETAWSYELGTKIELADGNIVVESAVYYIDWEDLQTLITIIPGALGAVITAGKAEAYGLDFGITAYPMDGLTLVLNGNINNSEYAEDVLDTTGPVIQDGQQIFGTPDLTLSASADYRWPIADTDWTGVALLRAEHTSERIIAFGGGVVNESDKITQASLRLGAENDSWGVFLFANNLFDEDGSVNAPALVGGTVRLRPRTIGVNLKYNFN